MARRSTARPHRGDRPADRRDSGARAVGLRVLRRVSAEGAYASLALDAELRRSGARGGDRALATELVYGVLRQQRRLDHVLDQLVSRSLDKVDPRILDVLRLGAYQLLFLDRVPAHAAVNEAVGQARRIGGGRVAGFVNAVLRRVESAQLEQALPESPLERLALTCSLPGALAELFVEQLGSEGAAELGRALLSRAPLSVRVNPLRATPEQVVSALREEGAAVEQGRFLDGALSIERLGEPTASRSYRRGWWTVQNEAAQLVVAMLDPQPGERVLELCSGVGSKSTDIAARMGLARDDPSADGRLVTADISSRKLQLAAEQHERLGTRCEQLCADLRDRSSIEAHAFDAVLVDAPCSGLGVLQRHPELKWRWEPGRIAALVALQRELLRTAVSGLAREGRLVYSVCTVTEQEGPQQLRWLVEQSDDLEVVPLDDPLGERSGLGVTLWPHRHGTDGFFIGCLRRAAAGGGDIAERRQR